MMRLVSLVLLPSCDDGSAGRRFSGPDASDPQLAWYVPGAADFSRPAVGDSIVYFVDASHLVHAVRQRDGAPVWTNGFVQTGAVGGTALTIFGDLVILPDVALFAFDANTGALRWSYRDTSSVGPGYFAVAPSGSTLLAGGTNFAYAVDAASGVLRWRVDVRTDSTRTIVYGPVTSSGLALFPYKRDPVVGTGGILALDVASGAIRWRRELPPASAGLLSGGNSVTIIDSLAIVASIDGRVWALSISSGDSVWCNGRSVTLGPLQGALLHLSASESTALVASNLGSLDGLDARTGTSLWTRQFSAGALVGPSAGDASDTSFTALLSGQVAAVATTSGRLVWTSTRRGTSGAWGGSLALSRSLVFAPGPSGLLAYRR